MDWALTPYQSKVLGKEGVVAPEDIDRRLGHLAASYCLECAVSTTMPAASR